MTSTFKTEEDVIKDSINNKKPTIERDFIIAKTFLKQQSDNGENVYDHLASLLAKIIDERPKNVMNHFDEFNRVVRKQKIGNLNNLLSSTYVEPDSLKAATSLMQCFEKYFNFPKEIQKSTRIDDFVHLQFYWTLAGYGCPQAQTFTLSCCLGTLENKAIVRKCRYWGRIYGIKLNYYIAEVELTDDETKKRVASDEEWGSDLNRKTYFVCHCLGDEWTELPKVTSKDIEMAQKIRKHFTGDLSSSIQSNPKFLGSESNLLRATIQRITTETYAAPAGYYTVDEGNVSINSNYNPIEATKLLDLTSWCQYRTPKITLCSENSSDSIIPTWTVRRMQEHFPKTSMVVVRSNVWPGAVSFCSHFEHDSLYMGWGVKYSRKAFIPPLPLTTSNEYNFNAETPGAFIVKDTNAPAKE